MQRFISHVTRRSLWAFKGSVGMLPRAGMALSVILGLGAILATGGCYERVVGVKGPGSTYYEGDVYSPNVGVERMPVVDDLKDLAYPPPPKR